VLERVALHQTRLRTPGLRLDARGVALGAKGLVLLPTIDRLVAFLALYTAGASLGDLLPSLTIDVVKGPLGAREVALTFAVDASDRLDRVAELARAAGGYTFTGTQRHFVQWRDAASPFGYDLAALAPSEAALVLAHSSFAQDYRPERRIELATLLCALDVRLAPAGDQPPPYGIAGGPSGAGIAGGDGPLWICAEAGLGPALIHYFVRSGVAAEVGVAEWPPPSELEPAPVRRYVFRVAALPERMLPLLRRTPGLGVFAAVAPGAAVELGWRHPIELRGCPVFPEAGLVLFRGGRAPLRIEQLPTLGPVEAFARVHLRKTGSSEEAPPPTGAAKPLAPIDVDVRVAPDARPLARVTAAVVRDLRLLRLIAYRLSRTALASTRIAFTDAGAVLLCERGIEAVPLGEFFWQMHPRIFVSAGCAVVPAVHAAVLLDAFGTGGKLLFLHRDGRRMAVDEGALVPLERALLGAQAWTDTIAEAVAAELAAPIATVALDSPGLLPLRDLSGKE
jgi:hypothetical protein